MKLLLTQQVGQNGGEDRSCGHNDADVGSQGVGQGGIFSIEINGTAVSPNTIKESS